MSAKNVKECCWEFGLYFRPGVCVLAGAGGRWEAEKDKNLQFIHLKTFFLSS